MKLYLTSAYDTHRTLDALVDRARTDSVGRHELVASPNEADVILFVEDGQFEDYLYREVQHHELVREFPSKTFMYNESDKPWCVLPGLYTCMPARSYDHSRQIAFPYLENPNPYVKEINQWQLEPRWLYSFVGSQSHRCRKDVIALADKCEGVLDTSQFNAWDCDESDKMIQGWRFAEHMARSRYVLCPRGIGPSSSRLFESLEAGIAPVIIADDWVAPPHIDWSFAVRINERDIHTIPEVLESIADEYVDRGRAAREAWESVYAPDRIFDTAVESIGYLLDVRRNSDSITLTGPSAAEILIGSELRLRQTARRWLNVWQNRAA